MWAKIRSNIQLGAEGPVSKYLGCNHRISYDKRNNKDVRVMSYDMTGFMKACVASYRELCGPLFKDLRAVPTPFLTNSVEPQIPLHEAD